MAESKKKKTSAKEKQAANRLKKLTEAVETGAESVAAPVKSAVKAETTGKSAVKAETTVKSGSKTATTVKKSVILSEAKDLDHDTKTSRVTAKAPAGDAPVMEVPDYPEGQEVSLRAKAPVDDRAVGFLEVYGLVCAFMAADAGCKAANVTLEPFDKNKPANADTLPVPLLVTIKFRGSVSDVTAAVEAGKVVAEEISGVVTSHIIPRPDENTLKMLKISGFDTD